MTTSQSKLFVGGLSWGTVDAVLFEEFAKYGPLDEAIVVRDKITGRSRGFGFVRFQNPDDAQRAREATDGNPIDGRVVRVDFASEKRRPVMGMNPYESMPYNGNGMQPQYGGGFPQQGYIPQGQPYGYPQYTTNMSGMYNPMQSQMPMHQMQYQQMPPRQMGYMPLQGGAQSPPAGFGTSSPYATTDNQNSNQNQ